MKAAATVWVVSGPQSSIYLGVFVPAADSGLLAYVDPGAGLVGSPEGDKVRIHFEDNRHRYVWLGHYANRVFKAAKKRAEGSDPESSLVRQSEVVRIGDWDDIHYEVRLDTANAAELAAWLGLASIDETDERLMYRHP